MNVWENVDEINRPWFVGITSTAIIKTNDQSINLMIK